jgi:DNA 3'-phosphatase
MWQKRESCYFINNLDSDPDRSVQINMYDFDGTLTELESDGRPFDSVEGLFESINDSCYVVIFSNQYGISKGKTTLEEQQARFENFISSFPDMKISVVFSTEKDKYRKPYTNMYNVLFSYPPPEGSMYCGDASGQKGSFAATDYMFAHNLGVNFQVPETLFLGEDVPRDIGVNKNPYTSFSPRKYLKARYPDIEVSPGFMIVMVGPQGVGKSSVSMSLKKSASKHGVNAAIISKDVYKGAKYMSEMGGAIRAGKSIIVDNTNFKLDEREELVSLAREHGLYTVCIFFDVPKDLSLHMTKMREQKGGKNIPIIAVHTYYKNLVKPTASEGFDAIYKVDGVWLPESEHKYFEMLFDIHDR